MRLRSRLRLSYLTMLVILLTAVPAICWSIDDSNIDWGQASPPEIHQRMAEGKAKAHLDDLFFRKVTTQEALANTQDNYDVKFYDVYIRVNDTTQILYGRIGFDVTVAQDAVTQLQIDLYSTMVVDSVIAPGGALTFSRSGNYVYVNLDRSYSTGEPVEFAIYYHGHPTEGGFQAFAFGTRLGHKVISSLSEPYFARTWWPCKDLMVDKPDSMNIAIEVDTTFYVGSNGTLDSTVTATPNSHIFYYSVRYPMASYLFSVAISVYTVWHDYFVYNGGADSMIITNATYPDRIDTALAGWGISPHALQVFTDAFGPYPFLKEKYGHANFEWGGGMEHQTMTSMIGDGTFGFTASTVVHEMSHQWWGDMITCASWHDIWLNEGWASYAEAVYVLAQSGWPAYRSYMNSMAYAGGGTIYCSDTTSVYSIFNGGLSYDKASWVPHMLRGMLGEAVWANAVDAYYHSDFQYGAATTEDFEHVFEQASGMDLSWFFDEWIHGTFRPNYYYYYTSRPSDSGGYDVYLVIKQMQNTPPTVFTMPIQFLVNYTSQPSDTTAVFDDKKQKLFRFNFDSDILSMVLDPAGWILKYAAARPWEMFIITTPDELRSGWQDSAYVDTVEALGGSGNYVYTITSGNLPTGLTIDNDGVISGISTEPGTFDFTIRVTDNTAGKIDSGNFSIDIEWTACCGRYTGGFTGNTDCDMLGRRNLADITALIDHVYIGKTPLCSAIYPPDGCNAEGNIDGSADGKVNLADITMLIDHVYISHTETAACQ